jgi:hypothetical protein
VADANAFNLLTIFCRLSEIPVAISDAGETCHDALLRAAAIVEAAFAGVLMD